MAKSIVNRAGLGGSLAASPQYTEHEESVLQILAIIFSFVSIVSTTLTFYWFLNMRRTYYHHLLMILIQSDMFKAMWFMIYAIAALTPGTIESASIFCQISGFFTAAGLKLSDFAVLMISVHSALYVFKPPVSIGEGGLYPYRYIAYFLWIGLPLLMASLAFINPAGAYVSGGTSCHLPVRPFWYRLALSWIPRYLIFIIILGTDLSIYFYIRYKFGDFGKNTNDPAELSQGQTQQGRGNRVSTIPPTPPLVSHGLLPETRKPTRLSWTKRNRSASNERSESRSKTLGIRFFWRWTKRIFPHQYSHSEVPTSISVTGDVVETIGASALETTTTVSSPAADVTPDSGTGRLSQESWTNFANQCDDRSPNKVSILSFLRDGLDPPPQVELINSEGHNLSEIAVMETRRKIRQQLGSLFIYPLAYMAMWALPFAAHTLQYNDYYAANPPFILSAVNTVILVSQSTVDCWIFNIKEKPWRQSAKKGGSVQRPSILKGFRSGWEGSSFGGGGGKSKVAMEGEARIAYRRREEERTAKASEIGSTERRERRERSWWDEMDDTIGTMSPLAESSAMALVDEEAAAAVDEAGRHHKARQG